MKWIVEQLTELWGQRSSWKLEQAKQPHEAHYLKLDCSKAKMRLGWHPCWHLEKALGKVIEWHRAYQYGDDMRAFSLRQISDFQEQVTE